VEEMEFMSKLEMQNEIDKYKKQLAEKSRRLEVLDAEKLDWIAAGERQDAELKDWKDTVVNFKLSLEQRDKESEALLALNETLRGQIEKQAAEIEELKKVMRGVYSRDGDTIEKQAAEIERLKEGWEGSVMAHKDTLDKLVNKEKQVWEKDRIIKACGEALEYYAHVLQIRCRMQEHDNGERAQSAIKLIKDAEK